MSNALPPHSSFLTILNDLLILHDIPLSLGVSVPAHNFGEIATLVPDYAGHREDQPDPAFVVVEAGLQLSGFEGVPQGQSGKLGNGENGFLAEQFLKQEFTGFRVADEGGNSF